MQSSRSAPGPPPLARRFGVRLPMFAKRGHHRGDVDAQMNGMAELFYRLAPISRIGVGANEILKDMIAQQALGMPK